MDHVPGGHASYLLSAVAYSLYEFHWFGFISIVLLHFAPMKLSESQKKYLRGRGHDLKPLITVGGAGLSESLLNEFESTLAHHELIKVKVRSGDRQSRDDLITRLCTSHKAVLIQRVGNVALLYRANPEKKPEKQLRIPSR
jgi:RNA-binding protein